jgi:hypothetical protein
LQQDKFTKAARHITKNKLFINILNVKGMKKKILIFISVAAISAASGWNFSQNRSETVLSDVALANVEALGSEIGDLCGGCATNCYGSYCCSISFNGAIFYLYRC